MCDEPETALHARPLASTYSREVPLSLHDLQSRFYIQYSNDFIAHATLMTLIKWLERIL